ncbi:MAG: 2-amino-4-hydroxy-6-hydroxymethyldihydropteridine diphosphokinase [Alphaproteobacteria bacterium]
MVFIGLGANLINKNGDHPIQSLQKAARFLQAHKDVEVMAASSIWKSAPVPLSDQPWYHNAVCKIKTTLSPQELLILVASIENKAGRVRLHRNEARVLDLDILSYNRQQIDQPHLTIPHPRMHERAFVLYPLQEIASDWTHPVTGKTIGEMIENLDPNQEIHCTGVQLSPEGKTS